MHYYFDFSVDTIQFARKCLEASGGTPRDGVKVILWDKCTLESRRIIFPSLRESFLLFLMKPYFYLNIQGFIFSVLSFSLVSEIRQHQN